ncbi:hypothetical protein IAQ67_28470 (plasmid) [Paenibacillus peoriae]|uniref:Uncharacterized protein n=1 Tax=Paenibacillus peoriae TaxID=59893 RepID=A0A7H0YH91_9BACL|nr:hypothetical protein [Paenibacillus peoriae]QNR70449.1 hypothetical protein IAQ67_28470 [Paenibacillus peoriae]
MAEATRHGKKRMKDRMGLNAKASDRQADLALERGMRHGDTVGRLHKWISGCAYISGGNGGKYIVYNNQLFIFNSLYEKVITVLDIPSYLLDVAAAQMKKFKKAKAVQ